MARQGRGLRHGNDAGDGRVPWALAEQEVVSEIAGKHEGYQGAKWNVVSYVFNHNRYFFGLGFS
jgi:hypothetical protein